MSRTFVRWLLVMIASLWVVPFLACDAGTAPETVLLSADLRGELPANAGLDLDDVEERSGVATLPFGGRVRLTAQVLEGEAGGRYVREVTVVVEESAGWEMNAAVHGEPINVGEGSSVDQHRMAQGVMVSQSKRGLCGTQSGQTMLQIDPEGNVIAR